MHIECKVTVKENGRFVLPIKIRQELDISTGDQLLLILDKDLKIVPLKSALHTFQKKIKQCNKKNISLVNTLKQTRQNDFENE